MSCFRNMDQSLVAQLKRELSEADFATLMHNMEAEQVLSRETQRDRTILSFKEFCNNGKNGTPMSGRIEMGRILRDGGLDFKFNIINVVGDGKCLMHAFIAGSESLRDPFEIFLDGLKEWFKANIEWSITLENDSGHRDASGNFPLDIMVIHRQELKNIPKMQEYYNKITSKSNIDATFAHILAYGEKVDVVLISIDNDRSSKAITIFDTPPASHYIDDNVRVVDHPKNVFILTWQGHNYCLLPEEPLLARKKCEEYREKVMQSNSRQDGEYVQPTCSLNQKYIPEFDWKPCVKATPQASADCRPRSWAEAERQLLNAERLMREAERLTRDPVRKARADADRRSCADAVRREEEATQRFLDEHLSQQEIKAQSTLLHNAEKQKNYDRIRAEIAAQKCREEEEATNSFIAKHFSQQEIAENQKLFQIANQKKIDMNRSISPL